MVQYVSTPWRDRQELLLVRQQFYGEASAPTPGSINAPGRSLTAHLRHGQQRSRGESGRAADDEGLSQGSGPSEGLRRRRDEQQQHQAVARVSMWMQRGSCPHMVESTALLMAAVLSDESAATVNAGSSTYAVRAAYSAAFSRFVTGLLDGHQDKQRKQSMYSIAKTIGLPATFVELRHQSTHEQLPSLAKLRSAARKALAWIWDYYWRHLADEGKAMDPCRECVLSCLREDDEAAKPKAMKQLRQWDLNRVLKTIGELQEALPGNQVFLKCLKLSKELVTTTGAEGLPEAAVEAEAPSAEMGGTPSAEELRPGQASATAAPSGDQALGSDTGWSRHSGSWKPKPIGIA